MHSFPEINAVHKEIWTTGAYHWDNRERGKGEGVVLQWTLSGSVAFWDHGERHEVQPGQAMLFRYGEETWYGLDQGCVRPYELLWILMTETPAVCSLVEDLLATFGPVLRMEERGEAAHLLTHTYENRKHGSPSDRFTDAETCIRLLISLYREQINERRGRDPLSYGRHLLETQFRSPRNLKEWAKEIGWSREHFTREFQNRYHETPAAYLRKLRLEHAKILLSNTGLSVDEVAGASGFSSGKSFHRAFRDHYGVPPGEARSLAPLAE